ncbi:hypothetical protein [Streptomyces sp. WM6378]|uniref:hypothetical protein n=1 Tax=Streptomyces sp. WM6378 TaxID=1415557 RepID=UPI0006AE5EA8|nr:hypothetical protein [Streptomyces sp. WM6378]KOU46854.1 hypothetical protein ADK54_13960 [Streptomyces sp. WM6378]
MKRTPEPSRAQDSADELGAAGSGVVLTVTFLLFAYIPATFIGELFGNRGVPASPWLVAPVVGFGLAVMMLFEPYLQGRSWWKRVDDVWGALLMGLSVVAPIVVGVVWPVSLWTWLPPLVPTALSFVPIVFARWLVARWHGHLRKRQRPRLGPFKPVPRVGESDSGDS